MKIFQKVCHLDIIGSTPEALKSWRMRDILFRQLSIDFE